MYTQSPFTPAQIEEKLQQAIVALQLKEFKSIRKVAEHFEVPKSTLADRLAGKKTRSQTYEMAQILSNAEENTLVQWIPQLTITGFPATPILMKEIADEIRLRCIQIASSRIPTSIEIPSINHKWIYRFQKQYPELKICYLYQLESNRAKKVTLKNIQAWFDMFQSKKVSDDRPRLLIMDGYSSYITGSFIAFCIEKDIDLLILSSHCFHLLQSLDIAMYGPMKRYHALKVDRYSRIGVKRIQRAEWLADAQEVIETRKKRIKGKRVKLQGQFVFSTKEILKIVHEAKEKPKEKKLRGRPRKRPIEESEEEIEEEELENSSNDSELELEDCDHW
ncbi:hypothetical protein SS1G_02044 [Sclerotinia sclerotiorum 1980 UF-70]|uniref:HTH CENPB-type domain-containing protein n=1 Tax=Sclerotinia sclerotiorum (strain ATCC 18683 / 1980 / Ss-1) TaxID=665079 RepID=A7E9R4_SCLS1|nr:hypothetical protein SS1G_02044 [Sclerotinia sclerotiorum 1980 UF-70]EDN97116.1 hypothetical protein SS1G_02044 [Sclerotinia sclerotiorum 1980 UF-70]